MTTAPTPSAPALPSGTRSVIVFGGSFDPPHRAHVELPRAVRSAAGADVILYVPAARSPLKGSAPGATASDRLAMLKLAVQDDPRSLVTSIELDRGSGEPSYTIDTLRQLSQLFGSQVRMRLLIGADQAADFHRWRSPHEIMALAEPLVMLRAPAESWEELRSRLAEHWAGPEIDRWRLRVVSVPTMDISATRIREILGSQSADTALAGLIPTAVLAYIRRRALYGAAPMAV